MGTKRALGLALFVVLLGAAGPVSLSVSHMPTTSNAAIIARLKTAGFNPNDPALSTKLADFAAKQLRVERLHFSEVRLRVAKATVPIAEMAAHLPPGGVTKLHLPPPQPAPVLASATTAHFGDELWVHGQNLRSTDQSAATYTLDLGACGKYSGSMSWSRADKNGTATSAEWWTPVSHASYPATIQVAVQGQTSNTLSFKYLQTSKTEWAETSVASNAPHLTGDAGLGLAEGTNVVYSTSADRVSTDPFATQGGSGEDILGRGVSLVNGATATASIISAQSYMDAVGYNQPTDSHRGASVTVQPANGRLETRVTWFYNPGESISYTIRWVVSYPRGMRPVNSIPKSSSCTDEQ